MYVRSNLPEFLGQEPGYPGGLNGTFELVINVAKGKMSMTSLIVYPGRDRQRAMALVMSRGRCARPWWPLHKGTWSKIASDFWE